MHFQYSCLFFSQIQLEFFDPASSSTASLISCSDQRCSVGVQSSDATCSSQNNQCAYAFQYGDGSGTSGYYISDLMHFDTILGGSVTTNSSAPVVFGWAIMRFSRLTGILFWYLVRAWKSLPQVVDHETGVALRRQETWQSQIERLMGYLGLDNRRCLSSHNFLHREWHQKYSPTAWEGMMLAEVYWCSGKSWSLI